MNSIAKALNNIAVALQSIANEMRKNKDVVISKTTTSNPYVGTATITNYSSDGWSSLSAAEKEQLYYIYKAIMEKGINPNHHDVVYEKVMDNLQYKWPSLHKPIEKLVALKNRSILEKNNYTQLPKKNYYK